MMLSSFTRITLAQTLEATQEQYPLKITDSAEKAQQRLAARVLSKRELAAVLNVCERTIEKWLAQNRIRQLRPSNQ